MSQISNLYSLNASKGQESSNQAGAKDKKQLIKGRAVKRLEDEHTLGVLSHILKFAGYEKAKRVCKAWEQASLRNEQAFLKKIQEGKKSYQIFVPYLNNIQGKSYQEVIRFFHELGSLWEGHKDYLKNVIKINQSQANLHVLRDLIQWHQDQNLLAFAKGLKDKNKLAWLTDLKEAGRVRKVLEQHSSELANLTSLNLRKCSLKELPKEIALFTNLQVLDLSYNELEQASDVSQCTQLQCLDLSNNQLKQAPDVSQCTQLQRLYLCHNQLKQVPDVSQCVQLQRLYLCHNQLKQAPDVSQCVQLQQLYLSHNQLKQAPGVSQCVQLQWLDLSHNQLIQKPDVSQCRQLQRLDLFNNQIS
jgi:Leucine-rich repeat (LRR) protein